MSLMDYRAPEWVSEQLGLDRNTVYKYLQEGIIPAVRVGKKWLISESKLLGWLEGETERQTAERRAAASSSDATVRRLDNYSQEAREVVKQAHTEARKYGHEKWGVEHLLLAASQLKHLNEETVTEYRSLFEARYPSGDTEAVSRRLGRSDAAKKAIKKAAAMAAKEGRKIAVEDIIKGAKEESDKQLKELIDHFPA